MQVSITFMKCLFHASRHSSISSLSSSASQLHSDSDNNSFAHSKSACAYLQMGLGAVLTLSVILHIHLRSTPLWSELARGGIVSQVVTWVSVANDDSYLNMSSNHTNCYMAYATYYQPPNEPCTQLLVHK